jgi:hypothetical protein
VKSGAPGGRFFVGGGSARSLGFARDDRLFYCGFDWTVPKKDYRAEIDRGALRGVFYLCRGYGIAEAMP